MTSRRAGPRSSASARALWDWRHKYQIDGDDLDEWFAARRLRRLGRVGAVRGCVLWWLSRRYDVVVVGLAGTPTRVLLVLDLLTRRRDRYLVMLHFIPPLEGDPSAETIRWFSKAGLRALEKSAYIKGVLRPVLRRVLVSAHVLTEWERERCARYFGLDPSRLTLVPWPVAGEATHYDDPNSDRRGVMSSGRASCDWETVFAAARLADWDLTVVCGRDDLERVTRLAEGTGATVLCEISRDAHHELLARAQVYLLALHESRVSAGQIRLADATQSGTPVACSLTRGVEEYIEDGKDSLGFAAGDARAAARAVQRILDDPPLARALVAGARERSGRSSGEAHREGIRRLVRDAIEEAKRGH